MAGISIKLSSIHDCKEINVEGLGVIRVRAESSNQGLAISENTRDIFKLQDEVRKVEKRVRALTEKGAKDNDTEIEKLESKATEKLDRITEIRRSGHEMRRARLSDDNDGKLVEKLFDNATDEDISKLFALADGLAGENDEQVTS